MRSELIQPTHLARKAVVYIRQSTPAQVVSNQESLRLQYALTQRARELGWREADVDVIDADLGLSGASAVHRHGFKDLTARVSLSEVGLILSVDVTRLARNCTDWYPLLDICGLRNCLIADRDGVYDPGSANGRLLLGLKGTISELELHTLRSRLTAGLLAKAARGDLALTLPVGLTRVSGDLVVKDADVEVQDRLRLVFQSFLRLRTAAKVMRMLNARGLDLPRRDHHGDLRWARATVAAVVTILTNPAYAGAFVYGRRRADAVTSRNGTAMKRLRPMQEWRFVVKDRYPAYIDWATYEKIRSVISDNRAEYMRNKTRGTPRDGELLLHGIVWCARCGHKMFVRYKGGGEYVCNHLRTQQGAPVCQHLRAAAVDRGVAQAFLAALAPAEIEALSQAHRARQQTERALRTAAEQQVERKRYQAALAQRQYDKVDPDNRLVASELERRWEAALIALRTAEEALARQRDQASAMPIGGRLDGNIVALSGRLSQLWHAPTTRDAQRKALLRCLVDKVVLDRGMHDVATARVIWRGGAVSQLTIQRAVGRLEALTRGAEMRERVIALARTDIPDEEIAARLTDEGHRSPSCAERVLPVTVRRIRQQAGPGPRTPRSRWRHASDLLGVQAIARRLNIPTKWLYGQIRTGRLLIDRQPTGAYLFRDTEAVRKRCLAPTFWIRG
ncbi:recombinase family protein [Methylobacterium sp. NEAU 140]|uniref:recombinase family protein n=1 Tax=Methylobacterium sp. NEAU 140 TaxID=3064945 RepID=UPI0027363A0C|nr:recombinase family protein [Methylobacterium sp. NEAU 140]MDP4026480.1 recombinase family protein [Methylobacterium sp. NEAU 140]